MTQYEQIVGEVAEASGTEIAIHADRVAEIAVDGMIVLVKPTDAVETSVMLFSVLVDEGVGEAQMKRALEMSLFGRGTAGGTIGLYVDSLIYSTRQALEGLSAQEFAERLVRFAHDARQLGDALAAAAAGGAQGPTGGLALHEGLQQGVQPPEDRIENRKDKENP